MLKSVLIPALAATLLLGGCVLMQADNAAKESKRLEEFDAGKPLPPFEEDESRGGGGGGGSGGSG